MVCYMVQGNSTTSQVDIRRQLKITTNSLVVVVSGVPEAFCPDCQFDSLPRHCLFVCEHHDQEVN